MTLIAIAMYRRNQVDGMHCNHYSTVFATCHFSTNCVDAVSLHNSLLSGHLRDFLSILLNVDYICIENLEGLVKERFKYTNIRQSTVHTIHYKVLIFQSKFLRNSPKIVCKQTTGT